VSGTAYLILEHNMAEPTFFLVVEMYFNPDFLKILEALIDPECTSVLPFKSLLGKEPFVDPEKPYIAADVFTFLLQAKQYVVLSLIRKGHVRITNLAFVTFARLILCKQGSLGRYVHTCPPPGEVLLPTDYFLVLRNNSKVKHSAILVFGAEIETQGTKFKATAKFDSFASTM